MPRKSKPLTITIAPEEKAVLESIAAKYGCKWGDRVSLSALMSAIGQGQLTVHVPGLSAAQMDKEAMREALAQIAVSSSRLLAMVGDERA